MGFCLYKYKCIFIILFFVAPVAQGIDFRIDLPPDAGVAPKQPVSRPPFSSTSIGKKTKTVKISRHVSKDEFPHLPCLMDAVAFWEKVYKKYDSSQGVVHHRKDVSLVYGVLNGAAPAQVFKDMVGRRHGIEPRYLRVQHGLKSRFSEGVKKSLQYLPLVVTHLKANGLPLDLMYLPHVESSYSNVQSRVGAVGIWQLMPGTMADLLGKWAVNLRNDADIATEAAVKLLKQNYEATGNWPLALTAYNHGLGGVLRGVRQTKSPDLCTIIERYRSPSFGFASSHFYAQFLAARNVAKEQYSQLAKSNEGSVISRGQVWAMLEQGIL